MKSKARKCGKRGVAGIVCVQPRGHRGYHWAGYKTIPGLKVKIRVGFCHTLKEKCHHAG